MELDSLREVAEEKLNGCLLSCDIRYTTSGDDFVLISPALNQITSSTYAGYYDALAKALNASKDAHALKGTRQVSAVQGGRWVFFFRV